jgi:hypothetical protein
MDVILVALMEIYWNRNYCVELLDKTILYYVHENNILAQHQMMLLSLIDMVPVDRL